MDTLEYRKLISVLDEQLERAKKEAETRQKKEALEQHVKLILHQITSFEARKAECEKFGLRPGIDIDALLVRLRGEKAMLEKQLVMADEPVVEKESRILDSDRVEVNTLIEEVLNTNPVLMDEVERWTLFEVWSVRWRIMMERIGQAAVESGLMKRAYALIREAMNQHRTDQGWFIDALDKTKGGQGFNWELKLQVVQRKLEEARDAKRREREEEEAEAKMITDLYAAVGAYAKDANEETDRQLRHAIRQAARLDHLREDVAEMAEPFREELEPDFAFLWQNGKPEEPEENDEGRHLSNREIVRRMLHRLKAKGCIGGSHAPAEKMSRGYPSHDQARAKEAVEVLVKAGVLRRKPTSIGFRVSLEAGMVARAESFFQGKQMGIRLVDEWCAQA